MSYHDTLDYVSEILTSDPDLSVYEMGEVIYELTTNCYKTKPVDIETFIRDPYYLGNSLGDNIYPLWIDLLKQIHPHPCLNMYNEIALSTAIGVGKCLGKGTRILMFDGSIKRVESVKIGDLLMGDDSTPRRVLSLARGREDMYEVVPSDNGDSFTCNKSHILSLKDRYHGSITNISVSEYLEKDDNFKTVNKLYRKAVHYSEEPLTIGAYTYGRWLGSESSEDTLMYNPEEFPTSYHIYKSVTSGDSSIPKEYLVNSEENRLKLLAGILDSSELDLRYPDQDILSVTVKNLVLAEDIVYLSRSLGFSAKLEKDTYFTSTGYYVDISGDFSRVPSDFRMDSISTRDGLLETDFTLNFLGEGDYYGFTLDCNHLYLLGDFTVTHNTTCAIISMVYEMYKLLCLKNPYEFYSITKGTDKFSFALIAPTHAQGTSVAFGKLLGMINTSPFFKDVKATPKARSSVSEEGIHIGDNITVHTGSKMDHLIGKLTFCGLMDEVSFFQGKDAIAKVKDLHMGFTGRKKSRFIHLGEFIPGVLWMVSSPIDEQDYLNTAIEEMQSNQYGIYFDNISLWEVKGDYLGDKFKVFLGDDKKEPCIIREEDKVPEDIKALAIEVPMEYYREFDLNISRAVRDIAGRRIRADISLFKSKKQLVSLFVNPNRFKSDVISMSFNDPLDKLENYVTSLDYFKKPLNPQCYRFIHLDAATKKDKFGISAVYSTLEDFDLYKTDINMPSFKRKERMFYVDFAVAIEARKGEEINIYKVMDFIFLLKKLGYPIKVVSSDMFQGDVMRQFLRLHGTTTAYLSVDRTKDPYYALKELVNNNKIIGVKNEFLIKELLGLRELTKKVDHLANSCFTGDTQIKLLDGTSKSFKELSDLGTSNEFWVYGCLPDGTIVPAKAYNAHKTKEVSCLVEVCLDDERDPIRCTPEHLFMMRDGSYKQAQYLEPKDSLMPIYIKEQNYKYRSGGVGRYFQIKNNKTGRYNFIHRLVASYHYQHTLAKDEVVHHRNFKPSDNSPENLEIMSISDHTRRHAFLSGLGRLHTDKRVASFKKNYWANPDNSKRRDDRLKIKLDRQEYMKTDKYRQDILNMRLTNENIIARNKIAGKKLNEIYWKSSEGKARKAEVWEYQQQTMRDGQKEYFDELAKQRKEPWKEYILSYQHAMHVAGGYVKSWAKRIDSSTFQINSEKLRGMPLEEILRVTGLSPKKLTNYLVRLGKLDILPEYNHKVVRVSVIELDVTEDVYDITVPSTNNFALDNGIFVHNSKDLSDSVTGGVWSCLNSCEYMNLQNVYEGIVSKNEGPPQIQGHIGNLMKEAQNKQKREGFNKTLGF